MEEIAIFFLFQKKEAAVDAAVDQAGAAHSQAGRGPRPQDPRLRHTLPEVRQFTACNFNIIDLKYHIIFTVN